MSRIAECFAACAAQQRVALVGYLTAFDPDRAGSRERLFAACEAGLDLLELGVPFSDPTADGPDIQAAMVRALRAGASVVGVLELAAELRARFELPIVLFSYANPLLARGPERVACEAAAAGVDGLLVVDLPPSASVILREPARAHGLDWIGLCAPTTTPERLEQILAVTTGFLYAVSLTGVTGAALDAGDDALHRQLERVRERSRVPVAVGFGIREPAQVAALTGVADAVVVGSALVRAGMEGAAALAEKVAALRAATKRPDRSWESRSR